MSGDPAGLDASCDAIGELVDLVESASSEVARALQGDVAAEVPFGYARGDPDDAGAALVVDPDTGPIVGRLFERCAAGVPTADLLDDARPHLSRAPDTTGSPSRPFDESDLHDILRNDFYIGFLTVGGVKYRGRHQPITTDAMFDAARDALVGPSDAASLAPPKRGIEAIARCGGCGAPMVVSARQSDPSTMRLICVVSSDRSGDCRRQGVGLGRLESWLRALVAGLELTDVERQGMDRGLAAACDACGIDDPEAMRTVAGGAFDVLSRIVADYGAADEATRDAYLTTLFEWVAVGPRGITGWQLTPLYRAVLDERLRDAAVGPTATSVDVCPTPERAEPTRPTDTAPAAELGAGSDPAVDGLRARVTRWLLGITLVNLCVWFLWARTISESDFDDRGILAALPIPVVIATMVALLLAAVAIARRLPDGVVTIHVAVLVVMLFGIGAVVGNSLQARIVLRHEGIADAILRTGSIDPEIDAYFNWPGMFSYLALVRAASGHGLRTLSLWAPVLLNLLYIGPILVMGRAVARDGRAAWATVVVFLLGNWVGQDYLSPQGLTFAIYLTILAILLVRELEPDAERRRSESVVTVGLVIVLFLAIVPSHQLTPMMTLASACVLVVVRRSRARGLPVLMAAIVVTWLVFMSAAYLRGNLSQMLDLVGDLRSAGDANVTQRLGGSAGHREVVRIRLAWTGVIGLIAGAGWVCSLVRRRHNLAVTALAAVPVPMLILQPYGGEMILRVFLFSLPFLACYVVEAGRALATVRWRMVPVSVIGSVAIVAILAFFVARYGNARLDIFTDEEEQGIDALYDVAAPDALLLAAIDNVAWKHRGYESYDHETIDRQIVASTDPFVAADAVVALMNADPSRDAYFIATQSQQNYVDLLGGLPPRALPVIEELLRADPSVVVVLDRPSIRIYAIPSTDEDRS